MDKIDLISFMAWSAGLAVLSFTAWQLIACQCAWIAVYGIGKAIIDRKLAV
jgi:4-hydroxybenzoate polyprenyltransferase